MLRTESVFMREADNGEFYLDLDGIRLVWNDVFGLGWYNPGEGGADGK
jgi:hypothetical protein